MQLHGERTRLACRRGRLDHDFKTPTFLSLFGAERMVVGSIRRDAEYHTPEAYAPHFNRMDSAESNIYSFSFGHYRVDFRMCPPCVGGEVSHEFD